MIMARENKYSKEKKCLIVTLSTTRLAWNDPGLILGLSGDQLPEQKFVSVICKVSVPASQYMVLFHCRGLPLNVV